MYRALSLSVALGVGLLASVPAVAADKVTWNISLYGPPRAATVTFAFDRDAPPAMGGTMRISVNGAEVESPYWKREVSAGGNLAQRLWLEATLSL